MNHPVDYYFLDDVDNDDQGQGGFYDGGYVHFPPSHNRMLTPENEIGIVFRHPDNPHHLVGEIFGDEQIWHQYSGIHLFNSLLRQ